MARSRYIDRERFWDGSARWLWCVYQDAHLWRAGVSETYEDCDRDSAAAYSELIRSLPEPERSAAPPAKDAVAVDLDWLAGEVDVDDLADW